ncbi:MAG: hypothetical protein M3Q71_06045 [Chloroflexota bacterium]|nr:hypothetical protein [Chloroflexota bacterium]MDP9470216.1 hypothetical protein [Chloroflexota bacterium]
MLPQHPDIVGHETPLTQAGIPTILEGSMMSGDPLIHNSNDTPDGFDLPCVEATAQLLLLTVGALIQGSGPGRQSS